MKRLLTFGGGDFSYAFPDTGNSYSDNFANIVTRTTRLPGADGGFDELGDSPGPKEVGNIRYTFWLFASSRADMHTRLDAVRAMATWDRQKLFMQPEDPDVLDRYCLARLSNISTPERANARMDQQLLVSVNFQVADPYWYGPGTEGWTWGDGTVWGGSGMWGGAATWQNASGTSTDLTISPAGNARTLPRLSIWCDTGQTCQNPTIQRIVEGIVTDEISYSGTLTAGQTLHINCRAASVLLGSTGAYDDFSFNHPDWLRLYPGDNTVRIGFDNAGDAAKIKVRYYDAYT